MDLLRWFRFLWAIGVGWDQATRVEARDFCRWLQVAVKPTPPHWRHPDDDLARSGRSRPAPGVNAVTGKPGRGEHYEAATVVHCETVLRGFYDFHLEAGTGPMVNPFPLSRHRSGGRAHAHHNPMEPFAGQRSSRYRPKLVTRAPRCIPDERFDQLARPGRPRHNPNPSAAIPAPEILMRALTGEAEFHLMWQRPRQPEAGPLLPQSG